MAVADPSSKVMEATNASEISGVPTVVSAVPSSSVHHWYKNLLQEYSQTSGIQLPIYSTINEGEQHAPKFRSTVLVDGLQIQSNRTFSHRKEAEQYVAKFALDYIALKFKNEGVPNIYEDPLHCKSILYEYGVKLKIGKPTYSTIQKEGTPPVFVSTITFNEESFIGHDGKNKKEAEQNAARIVIDSILANPYTRTAMIIFIKAKYRLLAADKKGVKFGHGTVKSPTEGDVKEQVDAAEYESLTVQSTSQFAYPPSISSLASCGQVSFEVSHLDSSTEPFISMFGILKKGKKRSKKKKQGDISKRARTDEQSIMTCRSSSANPTVEGDASGPTKSANLNPLSLC
ncbi:Double-stranded RNA-binding protein 4 [Apostasia shenzhenica]|uniref:Double-stranded RNA-binding protein 4 n=1 Tax=Apostasia shenzhenica TaxID=1088818 RepID=A0A2I0B0M1_9ASPA|nr:Double-stranded RNA-binding protein 4 [Apostasia shenzhenica]